MPGVRFLLPQGSTLVRGILVLGVFVLAGCSGSVAPVSGKVTFNGKEVPGGTVTFSPIGSSDNPYPGKPAMGLVQKDGTYVLGTNGEADGAWIGRHKVLYIPPQVELPPGKVQKTGDPVPKSPYDGLIPRDAEVEVKSGSNTINVELVPGKLKS